MEIHETIDQWFEQIENRLQQLGLPKNNIDQMVYASIAVVDNYLNNAMRILQQGSRLPAMALLRIVNQFSSRIVWVLMGHNKSQKELQNRFSGWQKDSYIKERQVLEKVLVFYQGKEKKLFESRIKEYVHQIDKLQAAGVKELPQPEQILEEVFGTENVERKLVAAGMWRRLHQAVHPDLLVLGKSTKNNGKGYMYDGDVDEKVDNLKFECLICAHRFFKEIYAYYDLDFQENVTEYELLIAKRLIRKPT